MPQSKDRKKHIRELAALLDENNLTEIEIEEEGLRIRVARTGGTVQYTQAPAPTAAAPAAQPEAEAASPTQHPGALKCPMVGTVYVSPEPGAAPFVTTGDTVKQGQTVFIIEAMKVMNPIKAQKSGRVTEILVSDSQPVEFEEVLMIIE